MMIMISGSAADMSVYHHDSCIADRDVVVLRVRLVLEP
jgi:hypothetical protein